MKSFHWIPTKISDDALDSCLTANKDSSSFLKEYRPMCQAFGDSGMK